MKNSVGSVSKDIVKSVLILLFLATVGYFLTKIISVIAYIAIAIVLAMAGRPLVTFFTKKCQFPNVIAALMTMILFSLIVVMFLWMMIPVLLNQEGNISTINWAQLQQNLQLVINQLDAYLETFSI